MSASLIGPFTFLVRMRPFSLPSRILTLTWVISPATPVLPTIWTTSAGVIDSALCLLLNCRYAFAAAVWAPALILASSCVTWSRMACPSPASVTAAAAVETSMPMAGPICSFDETKT
jgi:hypothetical protein